MQGGFARLWKTNARVRTGLGCPLRGESPGQAAEQVFESGTMYWWGQNQQIYVLSGTRGGSFSVYPNTWREGEELAELDPPSGLHAPVRGFGKVWRNYPAVNDALGWGLRPEAAIKGVFQRYEKGTMLWSPAANGHGARIYVLFSDGSFAVYPDAE